MNSNFDKAIAKISMKPIPGTGHSNIIVETPVWRKVDENGVIYAKLALFGDIQTFGSTEEELDIAIKEALICFFTMAGKHGKGVKEELKLLGWQVGHNKIKYKPKRDSKKFVDRTSNSGEFTRKSLNATEHALMPMCDNKRLSIAI